MKRILILLTILLCAFVLTAYGQPATTPSTSSTAQSQPTRGVGDVLSDPNNITFLTFLGANLADAKTDWHFTGPITQKQYTFTPAQRLSMALGTAATALYLREQFPKLRKPVAVGMGVLTAYFAGRALSNTYNHGADTTSAGPAAAIPAPKVAFAIQIRR